MNDLTLTPLATSSGGAHLANEHGHLIYRPELADVRVPLVAVPRGQCSGTHRS